MAPERAEVRSAPLVVAVGGRVAAGKSHVARALAGDLGAALVEADRIRDDLLGAPSDSHPSRWSRSFRTLFATQVYAELEHRAEELVRAGRAVVLDACFPRVTQREAARSLARRYGAAFLFVECRVDAATLRDRLAARDAQASGGWTAIAEQLSRVFEPVEEIAGVEYLALDTDRPLAQAARDVAARLARRRAPVPPPDGGLACPEAVTFDCWNTLIFEPSWQTAHARRVAALVEAGRTAESERAGRAFDAAWERHMRLWGEGVATGAGDVARWALAELGLRDPQPALARLTRSFEEASHSGRVATLPGACETLDLLARAGVRRALICDTGLTPGRVVRRHLERLGLLERLEVLVFSDELGVPKPDPRAFLAALDGLGVSPQSALHLGDLRRTDVAGARGVGMATARIRARHDDRSTLPDADHVVASHAELQELLARCLLRAPARL